MNSHYSHYPTTLQTVPHDARRWSSCLHPSLLDLVSQKLYRDDNAMTILPQDQITLNDINGRGHPLNWLVHQSNDRSKLVKILTQYGVRNRYIEPAIHKDQEGTTNYLIHLFQEMDGNHGWQVSGKELAVLNPTEADHLMTLIIEFLDANMKLNNRDQTDKNNAALARRLLLRISKYKNIIPTRLVLPRHDTPDTAGVGSIPGSCADMYTLPVSRRSPNQLVAVKKFRSLKPGVDGKRPSTKEREEYLDNQTMLVKEAILWRNLAHDNVVPFLGISNDFFPSYIPSLVSKFMPRGTIRDYLVRLRYTTDFQINKLLQDTIVGIQYLHEENLIHGDLKGDNILIDTSHSLAVARITDFGISTFIHRQSSSNVEPPAGAWAWRSPERLDTMNNQHPTAACDIYSFACVCIQAYTGTYPFYKELSQEDRQWLNTHASGKGRDTIALYKSQFKTKHSRRIKDKVMAGQRPGQPQYMAANLYQALWTWWAANPAQRGRAEDVSAQLRFMTAAIGHHPNLVHFH